MRVLVLGLFAAGAVASAQVPHARWTGLSTFVGGPVHEFPSYAIHAMLLANGDVLAFQAGSSPRVGLATTPSAYVIQGLSDGNPFAVASSDVSLGPYAQGTPGFNPVAAPRNHRNLFCSAHHILPDALGTILFAGGDDNDVDPNDVVQRNATWSGANTLMLFRPNTGATLYGSPWVQLQDNPSTVTTQTWITNPLEFQTLQRGRWYPGITPIGSGRFLVSSGTNEFGPGGPSGGQQRSFEVLTLRTRNGAWIPSADISLIPHLWDGNLNAFPAPRYASNFYPFLFPMRHTSPQVSPQPSDFVRRDYHWLFVSDQGRILRLPLSTLVHQGHWGEHNASHIDYPATPLNPTNWFDQIYPSAAWFDGKALISGGSEGSLPATSHWALIDTTGNGQPTITASSATTRMRVPRKNHAMVTLPNGKIMAIGGNIRGDTGYYLVPPPDPQASYQGEPALAPAAGDQPFTMSGTYWGNNRPEFFNFDTKTWEMPAGVEHIMPLPLRGYHTTALLLPSGHVLVGGGDPSAEDGGLPTDQRRKFLYTPDYIPADESTRPETQLFVGQDRAVFYGQRISAQVSIWNENIWQGHGIRRLTAISLGSMTHAFDMGQRAYDVKWEDDDRFGMSQSMNGSAWSLFQIALQFEDPWYMPPGWYMLFAEDTTGRVSKAAMFRLVERYSIDLPTSFSAWSGSAFGAYQGRLPIVHGDMTYPAIGPPNGAWGGVHLANPTLSTSTVVSLTGAPPAIRVRNFIPTQVNLSQNDLLQVKIEAQTDVDAVTPQFFVRTGASTWASASIHSSTAAGTMRQFSRRERYREFVIDPSAMPLRDTATGEIEVEIRFPGASTAHVDMVQVGGYLQSVPY